jgi:hypothetical protein
MKIIAWPRKLRLRGHRRSYGTPHALRVIRSVLGCPTVTA